MLPMKKKKQNPVGTSTKIQFVTQTVLRAINLIARIERGMEKLINRAERTLIQMANSQDAPGIV